MKDCELDIVGSCEEPYVSRHATQEKSHKRPDEIELTTAMLSQWITVDEQVIYWGLGVFVEIHSAIKIRQKGIEPGHMEFL